jgi:tetratricopeptide (TPR) repeat protein
VVIASVAFGAAASAWSSEARADGSETDKQIAQSLFDDGRALLEAGHFAEACPKFAESQRLDPGGGTLLNLALCHELEGKTATASTEFREALSIATRDDRKDRQELASSHIAALAPKLTRLTVVVPERIAASNAEVTLDRSHLPAAAWNTEIPIDPGEHRVAVVAPGLPRWETSIATMEAGRTYRVEVPPALDQQGAPNVEPRETRGRSTAFWLVLGGAGLSLVTSVITGLMALDANKYVKDNCTTDRNFCRVDDADEHASRAKTLAWVSTATLVVGAGAAVFAFVLPLEKKSPVTAGFVVRDGVPFATLSVTPRF